MFHNFQLSENWLFLIFISFVFVTVINGVIASTWRNYYQKVASGRLSHSQLRIKQGNATFEQRINVFTHTFVLSFFKFRIYFISALLSGVLLLLSHFHIIQL